MERANLLWHIAVTEAGQLGQYRPYTYNRPGRNQGYGNLVFAGEFDPRACLRKNLCAVIDRDLSRFLEVQELF
jgi:hypothetical protein